MATPAAYRTGTTASFTTVGAVKQVVIPATVQVGDLLLLQWTGGSVLDSPPAGWTEVGNDFNGVQHIVWRRTAQAGDAGSTVVVAAASTARSNLNLEVYSGASTATPIAGSSEVSESTTQTSHTSASIASMPADTRVVQFFALKDGATASAIRTAPTGYTLRHNAASGATFSIIGMTADSNTSPAAGTVAAATWATDQASATASMISVAIAPASSTVGVRPGADTLAFTGATLEGGSTLWAVTADDDPNTRVRVPLSATANPGEIRLVGVTAPLKTLEVDVQCSPGTATLSMVVSLYQGTTLIRAYPAFTTVNTAGVATFSTAVSSADQTAQTNIADIRVRVSVTGS